MRKLKLIFYALIALWFLITASTLLWWFYLILKTSHYNQAMVLTEGITLISLIVFGGLGLLVYNFQYIKSKEKNQQFLLAFAHDLKTSLASILMTLDNREKKLLQTSVTMNFSDIKSEILRINTLLENSLLESKNNQFDFYKENIDLNSYFEQINLNHEIFKYESFKQSLKFDKRYFDLIVRNILYNSVLHGEATEIKVTPEVIDGFYLLSFHDNGQGSVKPKALAQNTGMGLKLIDKLLKFQNGSVTYKNHEHQGFLVQLRFSL